MRILIFGFKNTIAESVMRCLNSRANYLLTDSTEDTIDELVNKVVTDDYDLVLGLGQYGGRDVLNIRIEATATSQFRNNKSNLETIAIPYVFKPQQYFKVADSIGNSWCNLVSYKLIKTIPDLNYTFLHISRTFDASIAAAAIEAQLDELRNA